ncbi:MAG: hypothetical protein J7576_13015 [Siphonobacter aquaeclarae]|nr:hypothetical protein [Siphonobacter aquaeclarae]
MRYLVPVLLFVCGAADAQTYAPDPVIWKTPSRNSSESMPCGGGDIGLNVWVENGELLCYIARSGSFDENNAVLKTGRLRIKLSPNILTDQSFEQELRLSDGSIRLKAGKNRIHVWVDVFRPVVHVEVESTSPTRVEATYESWRTTERTAKGAENKANTWKHMYPGTVTASRDSIRFDGASVLFFHQNGGRTVFDTTVAHEGLSSIQNKLYDPLKFRTFGGRLTGTNLEPAGNTSGKYGSTSFSGWKLQSRSAARQHRLQVVLHTAQEEQLSNWLSGLKKQESQVISRTESWLKTAAWWKLFWDRSHLVISGKDTLAAQAARNYTLFRYLMGCNARGEWPTKFNGGLFTYDPEEVDPKSPFTPDFRAWGGGTHTAQNQRLVYFPMLKTGDTDVLESQLAFYLRLLPTAEARTRFYWGHNGASFTEQLENFGLPNPAEYGWKRPASFDKGLEYNKWLEYLWDTSLEFCLMMLDESRYTGSDAGRYLPFIESCLTFFDEHYQYLARQRGAAALDGDGHLVLYPGSAAETYKMAYNANSTIAGLKVVTERLLETGLLSPEKKKHWEGFLTRIPPLSFRQAAGRPVLSPALHRERVNNTESPQLYPVYPWGIYGIGKAGLDTARNTYFCDPDVQKQVSPVGWRQHNIFAARLGLTDEAARLTKQKLADSGRRFPAFWGPGFDWTPDHNWGGSGMIGLQEMLMQTDGRTIRLFPAWPKEWDVRFKLHAPYQTIVEGTYENGRLTRLNIIPESRRSDVILPF